MYLYLNDDDYSAYCQCHHFKKGVQFNFAVDNYADADQHICTYPTNVGSFIYYHKKNKQKMKNEKKCEPDSYWFIAVMLSNMEKSVTLNTNMLRL